MTALYQLKTGRHIAEGYLFVIFLEQLSLLGRPISIGSPGVR